MTARYWKDAPDHVLRALIGRLCFEDMEYGSGGYTTNEQRRADLLLHCNLDVPLCDLEALGYRDDPPKPAPRILTTEEQIEASIRYFREKNR